MNKKALLKTVITAIGLLLISIQFAMYGFNNPSEAYGINEYWMAFWWFCFGWIFFLLATGVMAVTWILIERIYMYYKGELYD